MHAQTLRSISSGFQECTTSRSFFSFFPLTPERFPVTAAVSNEARARFIVCPKCKGTSRGSFRFQVGCSLMPCPPSLRSLFKGDHRVCCCGSCGVGATLWSQSICLPQCTEQFMPLSHRNCSIFSVISHFALINWRIVPFSPN
jgi:hypothetical protein